MVPIACTSSGFVNIYAFRSYHILILLTTTYGHIVLFMVRNLSCSITSLCFITTFWKPISIVTTCIYKVSTKSDEWFRNMYSR